MHRIINLFSKLLTCKQFIECKLILNHVNIKKITESLIHSKNYKLVKMFSYMYLNTM